MVNTPDTQDTIIDTTNPSKITEQLKTAFPHLNKSEYSFATNTLLHADPKNHDDVDTSLKILNNLVTGYGIEPVRGEWVDWYYGHIQFLFINVGDTYRQTIIYDCYENEFHITSTDTFIDQHEKRCNIQHIETP